LTDEALPGGLAVGKEVFKVEVKVEEEVNNNSD